MDFKQHAGAHFRNQTETEGENQEGAPQLSRCFYESEAEKGSTGDGAREKMYISVLVREGEKEGFNAAGLLKVLQCSDKTFMSQKGWIPK